MAIDKWYDTTLSQHDRRMAIDRRRRAAEADLDVLQAQVEGEGREEGEVQVRVKWGAWVVQVGVGWCAWVGTIVKNRLGVAHGPVSLRYLSFSS